MIINALDSRFFLSQLMLLLLILLFFIVLCLMLKEFNIFSIEKLGNFDLLFLKSDPRKLD